MPDAEPATVARAGDRLVFRGALLRDAVAGLWRSAMPQLDGARVLDLAAVSRVDSAGVALLAELVARLGGNAGVDGAPEGLAELRSAYRLGPDLAFAH